MKKELLIVDDEPQYRFLAAAALRRAGYDIVEARDGRTALRLIVAAGRKGKGFDLVLTDVPIEGVTPSEFISEIRASGSAAPVCAVAGRRNLPLMIKLMQIGMRGFIYKPAESERLVNFVNEVLAIPLVRKRKSGMTFKP